MGKNILQRTNERIAELNAKREADLAEAQDKISRAQESIAAAEADMHDAEFTGDIKAYETAQGVRQAANNVVSFHLARMDILSKNKLVTPSEDASVIGDGVGKINQAVPGYIGSENLRDLTGIIPGG